MTKIERGSAAVLLYPGTAKRELQDLRDQYEAALNEDASSPQRASSKSKAPAKAIEHDKRLAEIEASAVRVVLLKISGTEYQKLSDDHPPREGNVLDQKLGLNIKTFLRALVRVSVADRELDLDTLSHAHLKKLEDEAWTLHNEDDDFPKVSLVSLHKQARDFDSKPPSDSE